MSNTKIIKGWVRPAGVEVNGPGYELGSGCGWCEFNEVGQPEHGDQPATLYIGEGKLWTEEEVRDMFTTMRMVARCAARDTTKPDDWQEIVEADFKHIALKHGLTI